MGADDVELWVRVHNEVDRQLPVTAEGVRHGRRHASTLTHFLCRLGGEPVGAASCLEQGDLRSTDVAVAFFGVLRKSRRNGGGQALYKAVSNHARSIGKARLQCDLWEDEADGMAFLERRGFVESERFARVRLDLTRVRLPESAPPQGVEVVPFEQCLHLALGLFKVGREGADDMPSADPIEFGYEEWKMWEIERESLRHDIGQVALVDGEPVGFGTIAVSGDSDEGWNEHTAVLRAWRRRGIAMAIKLAQIRAAQAAGLRGLTTFSEVRNVPMRALNEQLGYRPLPDQVRLRGPLAS